MGKQDVILKSFLSHELLASKYGLKQSNLPCSIKEALTSDRPIIKAIALIVEGLDGRSPLTDKGLRDQLTTFLNNRAIW